MAFDRRCSATEICTALLITTITVPVCCLAQPQPVHARLNRQFVDAAWKHDRPRMLELLGQGADINAQGINGQCALLLAIGEGAPDADLVKLLLDKGADVNEKNDFGDTPLIEAAHFTSRNSPNVVPIVKSLLDKGADVHASGDRALLEASANDDLAVFKLLIARGADPNAQNDAGRTALMAALAVGSNEMVQALLEKGADPNPNAKDKSGATILMYAVRGGHADIVRHWLDKGADLKATNNDGETVLMQATDGGTIKLLISKGADLGAKDRQGRTALLRSVQQHLTEAGGKTADASVVRAWLDAGADVNAKDNDGDSALLSIAASWPPNPEVVRLLVKYGADVKYGGKTGETALKRARAARNGAGDVKWAAEGFDEIIAILRKAGATE